LVQALNCGVVRKKEMFFMLVHYKVHKLGSPAGEIEKNF
jgi:hypothetical protein